MKPVTVLRIFAILLLLLNGTGALFGGGQLMMHPDGSSIGLPLSLLHHSPFRDYLIPGIILFFANGISSVIVMFLVFLSDRQYPLFVFAQGLVLFIWILVEIYVIDTIVALQFFLGAVAILLMLCGWRLRRLKGYVSQVQGPAHGHS